MLSKGFYLGSILTGYLLGGIATITGFAHINEDLGPFVLLFGCALIIYATVVYCILLYRLWGVIQDGPARTTPGHAVGLLFVPLYSYYWIFQAIWGWAKDYNRYIVDKGLDGKKMSEGVGLALCIITLVLCFLSVIPPLAGIALYIASFALLTIFFNRAITCVNSLPRFVQTEKTFEQTERENAQEKVNEDSVGTQEAISMLEETTHRKPVGGESHKMLWVVGLSISGGFLALIITLVLCFHAVSRVPHKSSAGHAVSRVPHKSSAGLLEFSLLNQEWHAIPAGTKVYGAQGEEYTIAKDLAGLTVTLRIENQSASSELIPFPMVLSSRSNSQNISILKLTKVDGEDSENSQRDIKVPAGKSVVLELKSKLESYKDLSSAVPLEIRIPEHDMTMALETLPLWEVLLKQRK